MGQVQDVKVPDIGDFKDVEIIEVAVSPGEHVNAEDPLITLESDKASMEVPSPVSGTIVEVKVAVGDRVSEGSLIAAVEMGEASVPKPPSPEGHQESDQGPAEREPESKPERKPQAAAEAPKEVQAKPGPIAPSAPEAAQDPEPQATEARRYETAGAGPPIDEGRFAEAHASPSVRRFARELGADLGRIEGSGPKGRILREDVQAFVKGALAKPADAPAPAAPAGGGLAIPEMPEVDFSQFGPTETRPLSKIKRLSGTGLHRNWVTIPHVTHQ
ncbi:MAG: biotin/lipoyl-containing protein, partial [Rhodospirillales bacterium]